MTRPVGRCHFSSISALLKINESTFDWLMSNATGSIIVTWILGFQLPQIILGNPFPIQLVWAVNPALLTAILESDLTNTH
jgi:hypothetical protein